MTEKEKSISDILKKKKCLLDSKNIDFIYSSLNKFKQSDFDEFIKAGIQGNLNSFFFGFYNEGEKEYIIIDTLFKKFNLTDEQFCQIISCYKKIKYHYNTDYIWIKSLKSIKYKFTDDQLVKLCNIEYPINELLDKKTIGLSHIMYYAKFVTENPDPYEYKEEVINLKKYKGKIQNNHIAILLNKIAEIMSLKSYLKMYDNEFVNELINKGKLDKTIYDLIDKNNLKFISGSNISRLIKIVKPNTEFIESLSDITLKSNIEIIFYIKQYGLSLKEDTLNKLLDKGKYAFYKKDSYIDFTSITNRKEFLCLNTKNNKITDLNDDSEYDYCCPNDIIIYYDDVTKMMYNLIKLDNLVELYKIFDVKPTINTMISVCKNGLVDAFTELIEKYNIVPNKDCLDASAISRNKDLIFKIICYKINPDKDTFNNLFTFYDYEEDNIIPIVEIFIKNGLQISYNEIDKLISYGMCLDNLERFGITYDERLYFICFRYDYFHELANKWIIDKKVLELREMCKKKNMTVEKLESYMKNNNVKLDRYCVDNAFIFGNGKIKDYMYKLEYEPTIFTLMRNCQDAYNFSKIGHKIIDDLKIDHEYMKKVYE